VRAASCTAVHDRSGSAASSRRSAAAANSSTPPAESRTSGSRGDVPDHFGGWASPWPSVVAAASVTSTLRLGPMTINNDLWNPVVPARRRERRPAERRLGRARIGAGWRGRLRGRGHHRGSAECPHRGWPTRSRSSAPTSRPPTGCARCKRRPHLRGWGRRHILRLAATTARHRRRAREPGGTGVAIGGSAAGDQPTDDRGVQVEAIERRPGGSPPTGLRRSRSPELHLYVLDVRRGVEPRGGRSPCCELRRLTRGGGRSPWFLTGPEEEMAQARRHQRALRRLLLHRG
jgi:hypothetical protein